MKTNFKTKWERSHFKARLYYNIFHKMSSPARFEYPFYYFLNTWTGQVFQVSQFEAIPISSKVQMGLLKRFLFFHQDELSRG